MTPLSVLLTLAGLGTGVALAAGFLGALHPLGDSLAVFRTPLALALLALAPAFAWLGLPRPGAAAALLALAALASLAPHWVPRATATAAAEAATFRHYQKNLWFRSTDPAATVADIRASGADIVTLQEVRDTHDPVVAALEGDYPHQLVCTFATVGGVAVLSKFPIDRDRSQCIPGSGFVAAILDTPAGPVRALSIHLNWPYPHNQPAHVDGILKWMDPWDGPTVIGGDFNMVRWSHTLRRIARATGTRLAGPSRITLRNKRLFLNIAIDHVLSPTGGTTELRPRAGSDHNGLLATYTIAPGA